MNDTQTTPHDDLIKRVEFYPSVDDHVHIASRIGGTAPTNTLTSYSYYIFLFLTRLCFRYSFGSTTILWLV